ncbi:MAG: ABC transporter substrate-binding protein [Thermoleophilaceae bacterium]
MRNFFEGRLRGALMLLAIGGLSVGVAACGGGSSNKSSTSGGQPAANAKKGGTLHILSNGDVDYVDPGAAYYQFTFIMSYATQRPLFSYKPTDEKATPDLAAGPAQVSDGGKTITIKIKPGVKFSPPVNRAVTSKDVKYAIERGFNSTVANGYAGAYFGDLVGADAAKKGKGAPISGITTPDNQTIVFKLSKPNANNVVGALSLPLSAAVPAEYAKKFDKKNPSSYGQNQVATGPYMIKNNSSGKATGYEPGKRITLVRNPNWDKSTDYRPAYLDSIVFDEGNADAVSASRRILQGSDLANGQADFNIPPQILKQASQGATKAQLIRGVSTGRVRYISLNTTIKPFDNPNVRKAVSAIVDRNAMRLAMGGPVAGDIPTHFLPPGIPGFDQAGGMQGPGNDWLAKPQGDPALAAEYMKKGGYPSGKYTGSQKFLMVADDSGPSAKAALVAQASLQKLGFKLNFRQVPHDTMYTKFCNVPKSKVAICPSTGWQKDFPDPQSMLDPTFNGKNIVPVNNSNWPQLNDSAVNAALEKAAPITDPTQRAQAYGNIDKQITALAPGVPWLWDKATGIESKNVNGVLNKFNAAWDLSYTSLK